jgi:hypothetical protein
LTHQGGLWLEINLDPISEKGMGFYFSELPKDNAPDDFWVFE